MLLLTLYPDQQVTNNPIPELFIYSKSVKLSKMLLAPWLVACVYASINAVSA